MVLQTIRIEILLKSKNKNKNGAEKGEEKKPYDENVELGCGSSYVVSIGPAKVLCLVPWSK